MPHTILQGRALRSRDPAGVEQEIVGPAHLFYRLLRRTVVEAAESVPGTAPDRSRLHHRPPNRA
ncbi:MULTISPECIES: hypothetical protein [unclassified Streptomyces]|uniref:Uncharacterized protein n=1 Tax=Streptomyces sp. NBC_00180 TaxID=2903632 RepID=A0AAU1ICJ3_9ACTN|nr:hypothetical protein OG331_03800 [Streptomyces sp. NBC_01017]WSV34824.1 hypothetical protein OG331_48180 [Streptomyces sp. NBC_01017]